METDKEIKETLDKAGKVIFWKIMEKRNEIKSQGYEPQSLVIWESYYEALMHDENLHYCANPPSYTEDGKWSTKPSNKILGLEIVKTQLPDVLEVY